MNTKLTMALALLVAGLVPGSAWAAAITIDDTSPNDVTLLSVNDFEQGLFLNGTLIQQGLGNPANLTLLETDPLSLNGTWITFGQQGPASGTIYLVEPPFNPAVPALISDIFQYQIIPNTDGFTATILAEFRSDIEGSSLGTVPTGTDPRNVFLENGVPVTLGFVGLGIQIMSDVPEPATLGLMAFGLFALRRRHAA